MTVRKNFIFDENVAKHLEELAKVKKTTQTALVQEMVEMQYKEIEKQKKLDAFYAGAGVVSGVFGDLTIQEIKASRYD